MRAAARATQAWACGSVSAESKRQELHRCGDSRRGNDHAANAAAGGYRRELWLRAGAIDALAESVDSRRVGRLCRDRQAAGGTEGFWGWVGRGGGDWKGSVRRRFVFRDSGIARTCASSLASAASTRGILGRVEPAA